MVKFLFRVVLVGFTGPQPDWHGSYFERSDKAGKSRLEALSRIPDLGQTQTASVCPQVSSAAM